MVVVGVAPVDGMEGYGFLNGIPEVGRMRIPLVAVVVSTESGKMAAFDLRSTGHAVHSRTNGYARRSIDYCCSSAVEEEEEEAGLSHYPGTGRGKDRGTVNGTDHCRGMEGLVVDCMGSQSNNVSC